MQVKDNLVELEVVYSKLNKALDENISRLNAGATAVDNYNKKISVVPSEFQKSLTDIKVKTDAVTVSAKKLEQQQEKSRLAEIKLQQAREKAFDKYDKQLAQEQSKLNASQNLYNKVQTKLNALSNEYKNLATKKELANKLTTDEANRYAFLQTKIQTYDKTLKAVDATMGKYQRNVGNYASAFNPLSNSINQLTREMPAFANSVQTGFMAISNNLPIFFDAIQQTNAELKIMRANGEATPSLFSKLSSSILSVGTALSIGVTLLTIFGDEIVDAIFNTKAKAKADEEAKKAIEEKNKAEQDYIDTMKQAGSEEISRSQILLANASNVNIKMRDRLSAIKELKERYPDYLGHLSDEAILSGKTAEAEEKLNEALMKRGIAIALQGKLTEKYNELTGALLKINTIQNKSNALTNDEIKLGQKIGVSNSKLLKDKQLISNLSLANANREKKSIEEQIAGIFKLYNQYSPYLSAVRETGAEQKKTAEETQKSMTNSEVAFKANISALESQLSTIDRLNPAYGLMNGLLQIQKELYDQLFGSIKKVNEESGGNINLDFLKEFPNSLLGLAKKIASDAEEMQKILDDFYQTFVSDFGNQSGFGKTIDLLSGGLDKFKGDAISTALAVSDAFQEAFNTIAEMSNANFENEYNNLKKQYDTALLFAGDSASARAEIERQAEEKRKQIAIREFKAQKAQALFNIAINTAQAVIGALAQLPSPSAVPLSIAVGAIGLVQAGIVASREIPQYWTGTENAKEGFALTQERGREIIMDRFGKIKDLGSDDGAKLTKMKSGDKVLNNEKTMELLMFNSQFNNKLVPNLNTMPNLVVNNNTDFTPVIKAIQNKPETTINFDNGDFKKFVKNGNSIKEMNEIRTSFKGIRL